MTYWDGVRAPRSFIPDVRSHLALWRRFNEQAGTWPILSIATYVLRPMVLAAEIIVLVWYSKNHGWRRSQNGVAVLLILFPILLIWFIIERIAWNHDLRRNGLSSENDVWAIDQFPEK
jgi:hypothetical protein